MLAHRFYGGSVTLKSVGVADCAPLGHYYSFLERRVSSKVNFPHFSMYWSWPYLLCHSCRKYRLHRLQDGVGVGITQAQGVGLPFPFLFSISVLMWVPQPARCLKQHDRLVLSRLHGEKPYFKCLRISQGLWVPEECIKHRDPLLSVSARYPVTPRHRVKLLSFVFMCPKVSVSFSWHFRA